MANNVITFHQNAEVHRTEGAAKPFGAGAKDNPRFGP